MSAEEAFQDAMPGNHCWGCGTLNEQGLQIKSRWEGEEAVCRLTPDARFSGGHTAVVYGGLLAAVMGCHAVGTATAAAFRAERRAMDSEPPITFVNASLKVDFLKPAPMGQPLDVRARIAEMHERKALVAVRVLAGDVECARGEVVAVRLREPRRG